MIDVGWDMESSDSCCQICLPGTPATVCFDPDNADCVSKTGDGDYDFLLLDQIWRPQFCYSLANGHDPTLTHLEGSTCDDSMESKSLLSIHGLWPNYIGGYPQCCNGTGATFALHPEEVAKWDIYPALMTQWSDPTNPSVCAVCLMLNHEWLKHGGCYSPGSPEEYFADTLKLDTSLSQYTTKLLALKGTTVLTADIEKMYPAAVNVVCDPNDESSSSPRQIPVGASVGSFLELQTCWSRDKLPVDCPPAPTGTITTPCPEYTYLRL